MIIFIRLLAILAVLIIGIIIITQVIIPSFRGNETWPYFKKSRKRKKLDEIQSDIEDAEADMSILNKQEVLLGQEAKVQKKEQTLEEKRNKLKSEGKE